MRVIIIKTFIGEELVAEFVADTNAISENCITVSRPRILQFREIEGKLRPSLEAWIQMDSDNKNVPLNVNYIASMIDAPSEISSTYSSLVSGIVLSK